MWLVNTHMRPQRPHWASNDNNRHHRSGPAAARCAPIDKGGKLAWGRIAHGPSGGRVGEDAVSSEPSILHNGYSAARPSILRVWRGQIAGSS